MEFDFSDPPIEVKARKGFGYDGSPTMSYTPQQMYKVKEAYNRHDWRELRHMNVRWWDQYSEHWCEFGPHFWDV